MTRSTTLEDLSFPGITDRSDRLRQFVTESTSAPWVKRLRAGDRITTSGPDRETTTVIIKDVCVHTGEYAGLDRCLKHPNRDFDIRDSHLFATLAAAFNALQTDPDDIGSAHPGEMTAVVYTIERTGPESQ